MLKIVRTKEENVFFLIKKIKFTFKKENHVRRQQLARLICSFQYRCLGSNHQTRSLLLKGTLMNSYV